MLDEPRPLLPVPEREDDEREDDERERLPRLRELPDRDWCEPSDALLPDPGDDVI